MSFCCRLSFGQRYDKHHILVLIHHIQRKGIHMNLSNSIALVTGASSGIGKATAERLAKAGYKVYGTSRRGAQTDQRSFEMLPLDGPSDESAPTAAKEF